MKKNVLIAVIALLALSGVEANAQIQNRHPEDDLYNGLLTNEEYFENSDYILEVIQLHYDITIDYYASKRGVEANKIDENGELKTAIDEDEIYSAWMLKVLRVYKGENVQAGDTIIIFAKGGFLWINYMDYSLHPEGAMAFERIGKGSGYRGDSGISFSRYDVSIIFGNNTEFPKSLDKPKNDHYLKIKIQNKYKARLFWEDGKYSGLNDLHFENRYELCKYMARFEGINVNLNDQKQMLRYLTGDEEARNQYIKEMDDFKK